jgi:hypothetical protein
LLEVFGLDDVLAGIREAMARGVIGFDAVNTWCCAGSSAARRGSL